MEAPNIHTDSPFIFNETNLGYFMQKSQPAQQRYCADALNHYIRHGPPGFKVVFSFGDSRIGGDKQGVIPLILKSRPVEGVTEVYLAGFDRTPVPENKPILGYLNLKRHYGKLSKVADNDRPFEEKRNKVVWRGVSTGHDLIKRDRFIKMYIDFPTKDIDVAFSEVLQLTLDKDPFAKQLVRKKMDMRKLLKHKYLLSLEGNDVASGLKWMLLSNSVVFMPPPTAVSWAMEDLLVPFYHYIPLKRDLTDLPTMLQWARENDAACQRIAQQSTQYMMDLIVSPEAKVNHEIVLNKTVARYHDLYGDLLQECSENDSSQTK